MGNQIYIKDTKFSIINGNVDGVRRYGVATIDGRTYSKIHCLRVTTSDGLIELGLPHGIGYLNLDGLFYIAKNVNNKVFEGDKMAFYDQFADRMLRGVFLPEHVDYLRETAEYCKATQQKTFCYRKVSNTSYNFIVDGVEKTTYLVDVLEVENFTKCYGDNQYYRTSDYEFVYHSGAYYLKENYENEFTVCDECGQTYHNDSIFQLDGHNICRSCDSDVRVPIESYSYTPEQLLMWDIRQGSIISEPLTDDKDLLAYELEVQFREGMSRTEMRKTCLKLRSILDGGLFYLKQDGSINGGGRSGVEIVSHPMTYDFFRKFGFSELFELKGTIQGWNVSESCGIHVHINRSTVSPINQYKICNFMNTYKGFAFKLSQRNKSDLNQWSRFSSEVASMFTRNTIQAWRDDSRNDMTDFPRYKTLAMGEKYRATNLIHKNTLEVRIFRSTMNEESFRKNVEFVESLRDWARVSSLTNYMNFKAYWSHVEKSGKFQNLVSWVKAQAWGSQFLAFPLTRVDGI